MGASQLLPSNRVALLAPRDKYSSSWLVSGPLQEQWEKPPVGNPLSIDLPEEVSWHLDVLSNSIDCVTVVARTDRS